MPSHGNSSLICALDVHYTGTSARAAAVTFSAWEDVSPLHELIADIPHVAPYEPGKFYLREMPCLLAVLGKLPAPPRCVIIDGYVWLRAGEPGLGHYLFEAMHSSIPVIGVAKTAFDGSPHAAHVLRGDSQRPLYVTADGLPLEMAAAHIHSMHGAYRLPALLKVVDSLCRS